LAGGRHRGSGALRNTPNGYVIADAIKIITQEPSIEAHKYFQTPVYPSAEIPDYS
jgi:hypothetical protein